MDTTSPWPDEPYRIQGADLDFARAHGGSQTDALLSKAEGAGLLPCPEGMQVLIDVRHNYVPLGKQQHTRTTFHKDGGARVWVTWAGAGATQVRNDSGEIFDAPENEWTEITGLDHASPVLPHGGWRYFMRFAWMEGSGAVNKVLRGQPDGCT